jgi:hypothetical protein
MTHLTVNLIAKFAGQSGRRENLSAENRNAGGNRLISTRPWFKSHGVSAETPG